MEYPSWFVCLMGMGTVFIGLIILIFAVKIMGGFLGEKSAKNIMETADDTGDKGKGSAPKENEAVCTEKKGIPPGFDKEILAAISAAIVADMGPGVDRIRITALKETV